MLKILNDLWNVLDDFEDLCRYGYRRSRREPYVPENRTGALAESSPAADTAFSDSLEAIASEIASCRKCVLCQKRKKVVPGDGVRNPLVMVIGEGPGAEEDNQGIPFVGAAGKYLDKWLNAISLDRSSNCFIGNIVKCRPPGNRDPQPEEIESCHGFLERQIKILNPRVIFTLGRISSRIITGREGGIGKLRGNVYSFRGIPVVVTYHPSAVLRDRSYRKPVWDDLKLLKETLDKIT